MATEARYLVLKATRPGYGPADDLGHRRYRCGRCGGVRTYRQDREGPPEYCKDCEPYAIEDGWMAPRPPRTRSKL